MDWEEERVTGWTWAGLIVMAINALATVSFVVWTLTW